MKLALPVAVLAAAGVAGGWTATPPSEDPSHPIANSGNRHEESVEFEVIVDEVICGLEKPLRQVVRNQDSWKRLWEEIFRPVEPVPERPQVDFEREMLIVVAMGTRRSGGFDITVQRITITDGFVDITVREIRPPPDSVVGMALTQPVEVVRLRRLSQRVVFHVTEETPDAGPE
jgi:hypothetical protein